MMESITLLRGDCLEVMKGLPDASVDAVVTDPPAGIAFMGKEWDDPESFPLRDRGTLGGGHTPQQTAHKHDRGFANGMAEIDKSRKGRDAFIDFLTPRMAQAYRIAKPGTYALVWALPRTSHWTAMAVEDAGWTIRDRVTHLFGSGFPKAKSCLKPAAEDWWLAYKPGGKMSPLQIDACRIGTESIFIRGGGGKHYDGQKSPLSAAEVNEWRSGRWPANVVLSHSEGCRRVGTKRVKGSHSQGVPNQGAEREAREDWRFADGTTVYTDPDGLETVESWECVDGCAARLLDEMSGVSRDGVAGKRSGTSKIAALGLGPLHEEWGGFGGSGGASRFFYIAKASRSDRGPDNTHPTVKSTDLMRWLCRLITPPGGTVLDPFAGSGSTSKACVDEGFHFIGIERDPAYLAINERRLEDVQAECPLFPFRVEIAP